MPSRFTAPLAAVIALLAVEAPNRIQPPPNPFTDRTAGGISLLFPTSHVPVSLDAGVFSPYLPDLQVLQAIFLTGLVLTGVGVLGLPVSAGGRRSRRTAVLLIVAGLAGAGTAIGLVGTAHLTGDGVEISALHSAADDQPTPYSPVCSHASAIPVCLHPAFRADLAQMTAALSPLLREVAALPGAPVRAAQVTSPRIGSTLTVCHTQNDGGSLTATLGGGIGGGSLSGTPPVFRFFIAQPPGAYGLSAGAFASQVQLTFVQSLTSRGCGSNPAQQAIQAGLLKAAGLSSGELTEHPGGPTSGLSAQAAAAASRFAALPAATRRAWLATHLAALRAGRVTVGQLP